MPKEQNKTLKRRKGRPLLKHHQEDVKAKIGTGLILKRLENHVIGKLELSATQIQAAHILLRKTIPDLSSIEQVTINPDNTLTEQEIKDRIAALVSNNPALLEQLKQADSTPEQPLH